MSTISVIPNKIGVQIDTGRDVVKVYTENLLDIQIFEEIKAIMESNINPVHFLRHLQEIRKNGLPKPIN